MSPDRDMRLIESGLVCLALAFVAKLLGVPILTWLMVIAAAVQIGAGIVIGIMGRAHE